MGKTMKVRLPDGSVVDAVVGPDINLDEEFVEWDGERLTEARAERLGAEIAARARKGGRPSLSGKAAHSPQIAVRVAPEVRDRLRDRAAREGKTLSQLAREALESYA